MRRHLMKWQPWIASALVTVGVASCGENSPPPDQSHSTMKPAMLKAGPPGAVTNAKSSPQPLKNDTPTAPADTQWTILCDSIDGPGHVANARDLKAILARQSGMPDWYVVHTDHDSTIYYGFYRELNNPAEKKRAELDR